MRVADTSLRSQGRFKRLAFSKRGVALGVVALLALASYGFVNSHRVDSAPNSGNARCAKVVSDSPDKILSKSRDWAIGDGVATWGDRDVVLRCGVKELEPTTNLCITANGVDWVLDEGTLKEDGVSVLTTYGRSPAVELTYSGPREEVGGILTSLKSSVDWMPRHSRCLGLDDVS
ncbi:DUF3515 family protein [Streptomyces sp. NBC_01361]|uniref:DUF3515 family protein n=1 Tax=Streptomyces sp. NBC_01361 TaxID=2903838 RepID=UPI002E33DDD3|nr:DUF3515 family protein [Streptomyces sp. NBC_01361]